jgi:hypothetical protein
MVINNADLRLAAELLKSNKNSKKVKEAPYGMYV